MDGGRVRVELANPDPKRGGGNRDRGGFNRGRGGRDRRRDNPPGQKTKYRVIVENISSRTSWQVFVELL